MSSRYNIKNLTYNNNNKIKYRSVPQPSKEQVSDLIQKEAEHVHSKQMQEVRAGERAVTDKFIDDVISKGEMNLIKHDKDDLEDDDDSDIDILVDNVPVSNIKDDEESSDSDDDDDDDDDEAELMREMAIIKAEREEKERKLQLERETELHNLQESNALLSNPLLRSLFEADDSVKVEEDQPISTSVSTGIKRRWDDDVVFKNQAKPDSKIQKKFNNDTIRSDFHRDFLKKYIR